MNTSTSVIYIADDDADDRYFLRQAIQATDPSMMIVEAEDGDHLLTLLDRLIQGPELHRVRLILLDMNMPKLNGLETLLTLKANPQLQHIPTVMFSTSACPDQVATAYQGGINGYIQKPVSWLDLQPIAQALKVCFLNASWN